MKSFHNLVFVIVIIPVFISVLSKRLYGIEHDRQVLVFPALNISVEQRHLVALEEPGSHDVERAVNMMSKYGGVCQRFCHGAVDNDEVILGAHFLNQLPHTGT